MPKGLSLFRLPHTPERGCYRLPGLPLTFHWALRLWRARCHWALSQTTGSSGAGRSMPFAAVVPLTFPIPCWFSVRVYQRETEAPLKSLFPSIASTEDHTVKDGVNAGTSYMALLTPVTKIMNDLLCHVSLPNGDHKSGVAVISLLPRMSEGSEWFSVKVKDSKRQCFSSFFPSFPSDSVSFTKTNG